MENQAKRVLDLAHSDRAISLADQSNIDHFLATVSNQLSEIEACLDSNQQQIARQAYQLLKSIIKEETGIDSIREGVCNFEERLVAEPEVRRSFDLLFRQIRDLLEDKEKESKYDWQLLRAFIEWYTRRRVSINELVGSKAKLRTLPRQSSIFGVRIVPDQIQGGISGLLVFCRAFIRGYRDEPCWLKVTLQESDEPVCCRMGWETWSDENERSIDSKSGHGIIFAAIQPLRVSTQRAMFDDLRIFIPYDAFDTNTSSDELTAKLDLISLSDGSIACNEHVAWIGRLSDITRINGLAPQSLGIFPHAPGEAKISGVSVHADHDRVLVRANVDIYGKELLPDSIGWRLECRVRNRNGLTVAATNQQYSDPAGNFIAKTPIVVNQPFCYLQGVEIDFPMSSFLWSEADSSISLEVSLVGSEGRPLVGELVLLTLPSSFNELRTSGGGSGEDSEVGELQEPASSSSAPDQRQVIDRLSIETDPENISENVGSLDSGEQDQIEPIKKHESEDGQERNEERDEETAQTGKSSEMPDQEIHIDNLDLERSAGSLVIHYNARADGKVYQVSRIRVGLYLASGELLKYRFSLFQRLTGFLSQGHVVARPGLALFSRVEPLLDFEKVIGKIVLKENCLAKTATAEKIELRVEIIDDEETVIRSSSTQFKL